MSEANVNQTHRLDRLLTALRAVRGSIQAIATANPLWAHVERVLCEVDADLECTATMPRLSLLTDKVECIHALLLQSLFGTHRDVFDKIGMVRVHQLPGRVEGAEWVHKATGNRYLVIVADMPQVGGIAPDLEKVAQAFTQQPWAMEQRLRDLTAFERAEATAAKVTAACVLTVPDSWFQRLRRWLQRQFNGRAQVKPREVLCDRDLTARDGLLARILRRPL